MNLQESIRRILREEQNKKVDLTPLFKKLLNREIVEKNSDILCGIEVVHPDNRESLIGNKFDRYKITFIFIGDPRYQTLVISDKYETIMNEAWDIIYSYTSQPIDMYSKTIKSCNE
jgi:hypothetical protein